MGLKGDKKHAYENNKSPLDDRDVRIIYIAPSFWVATYGHFSDEPEAPVGKVIDQFGRDSR